jgi:phosphohistidine phosphatase
MRGLARMGISFDVVLTSPLVRAKQTAEIVADECDSKPHIVTVESLAPGGSPQAVVADLEKQSKRARIALVGHEPDLGELAARFAGARHPFELKKGGICRIDFDSMPVAPPGNLRWLLTPRIMRSLKR